LGGDGLMSVNVDTCPLCNSSSSDLFDRRVVQASLVTNRLCKTCGLVYQSPRMSDEELESFYQKEYREVYQGSEGPNKKDLQVQRDRASALVAFTRNKIRPGIRHLDIGSSTGMLLHGFQNEYQTEPVGVEPGIAYRRYAQAQGLKVYESLDELRESRQGSFQLISLAHVLEHFPDPVAYLKKVRQDLLAEDGLLLLEVPNLYAHDSFELAHMIAFSSHTLIQTLKKAGFEVVSLRKHGKPRSRLLPLYITVLARYVQGAADIGTAVVKPEANVPLKRSLGMLKRRVLQKFFPHRAWLPLPTGDIS
jgi:2-polyprenyl-3-methyl-5-hydroxy-6-metoxy-1,4-benzoquinol methylase